MNSTSRASRPRLLTRSQRGTIAAGVVVMIALSIGIFAWRMPADFLSDDEPAPTTIAVDAKDIGLPAGTKEPIDVAALVTDGGAISVVSGGHVLTAGQDHGPAWSTIKVPIAIAALQNDPSTIEWVQPAIEWSSNEAAAELWYSLGDQEQSAERVEALLNELETSADFPTSDTHFGMGAFGDVDWPLSEQVRFAQNMWCVPEAHGVVEAMGNITEEHSWGLGTIDGARFKGGWGSDDDTGVFQSRQFGLIPVDGGFAPVAIAATAEDGSEETARAMLDELAAQIDRVRPQLEPVACVP